MAYQLLQRVDMSCRPTICALVCLAVFGAGCANYQAPEPCRALECTPPGTPLVIDCKPGEIGLWIPPDTSSVTVDGFDIKNCDTGISFAGSCHTCNLTLRNGRITGGSRAAYSSNPSGIYGHWGWNRIEIENVTINVPAGFMGIFLNFQPPELRLSNVTIEASGGYARNTSALAYQPRILSPESKLVIRNSTFSGFGVGINANVGTAQLENVVVVRNGIGIGVVATHILAMNVSAFDNREAGIYAQYVDSPSGTAGSNFTFRDVDVARNDYGVRVIGPEVYILGLNATENNVGLWSSQVTSGVTVRQAAFWNNTQFGIDATDARVDARENWWGASTGPTLRVESIRTPGEGDSVTPGVEFIPFSDSP